MHSPLQNQFPHPYNLQVRHQICKGIQYTISANANAAKSPEKRHRCTLDELDRSVIPKVAPKWFQLGRYLRLDRELLCGIKSDNSDDIAKCRDMFTEWLVRPELQPSWEKLIEALKSDVVSELQLAAEVSKNYLQ